jgi:hypothetical protein
MNFGYFFTFQSLDKGLIESLGPSGFVSFFFNLSSNFTNQYSGLLYHTIFVFIIFILIFLSFFMLGLLGLFSNISLGFSSLFLSYLIFSIFFSSTEEK